MPLLVGSILILSGMFLAGVFAGAETGLVSLDPDLLRERFRRDGDPRVRRLTEILARPERFIALTLIGTHLAIVFTTSLAAEIGTAIGLGPDGMAAEAVLMTLLLFVFSETIPKTLFAADPLPWSARVVPLIRWANVVLAPAVWAFQWLSGGLMRLFGLRRERRRSRISRRELAILLQMSRVRGLLAERPRRMAESILQLKHRRVGEVMVPRVRMVGVAAEAGFAEIRRRFQESGYSRLPVWRGSSDHCLGILHFRDLLLAKDERLEPLLRPAFLVPESCTLTDLLHEFRSRQQPIAVVVDEFGATAGLVTLEDVLEEVVGEIDDELDEVLEQWRVGEDGSLLIRADATLHHLNEQLDLALPIPEEVGTLNGLILALLGRIPNVGETYTLVGHRFEITRADQRRVIEVRWLRPLEEPVAGAAAPAGEGAGVIAGGPGGADAGSGGR